MVKANDLDREIAELNARWKLLINKIAAAKAEQDTVDSRKDFERWMRLHKLLSDLLEEGIGVNQAILEKENYREELEQRQLRRED